MPAAGGVAEQPAQPLAAHHRGAAALDRDVVAGDGDRPAVDRAVAADLAVARRGGGVLGARRVHERADLLEAPGIEHAVDVLAHGALAARVQPFHPLGSAHLGADRFAAGPQALDGVVAHGCSDSAPELDTPALRAG